MSWYRKQMASKPIKFHLIFYTVFNVLLQNFANKSTYLLHKQRGSRSKNLENDDYLIKTPGCTIPNIWKDRRIIETNNCNNSCGKRAVFIKKVNSDNVIKYTMKSSRMVEIFGNKSYECCSQFVHRNENDTLVFNQCNPFKNGTKSILEHEVVIVKCRLKDKKSVEYEDAYMIPKKIEGISKNNGKAWNVLMLGMDTMSRARIIQSMPKLVKYLKQNGWLDFRAFQKAEANTFPNIMILLTGKVPYRTYYFVCRFNIISCNHFLIWTKFKTSGFITAYGEDSLPDTFLHEFRDPPTDHFTRPFYLLGNQKQGNIACMRSRPATYHLLDYAHDIAKEYLDNQYFAYFFTSTYSHDPNHLPTLLQNQLIKFFKRLNTTGVLNNTIVVFFGDHGVRYGRLKVPVESFYDERLPMLFIWIPHAFRKKYADKFKNLQLNQHRLITHSDVHSTLWSILQMADENVTVIPPEYCPQCGSLFEVKSLERRCEHMSVSQRWCSCHTLREIHSDDVAATLVPEIVLFNVSTGLKQEMQIKKILRHQWFKDKFDKDSRYHVIAIEVEQGKRQYEGVVKERFKNFEILGEIDNISPRVVDYDSSQC